jgi:hypothetical protein
VRRGWPPLSAIRAVCASERPYGSVRGVRSDPHPYRDHHSPSGKPQDRDSGWHVVVSNAAYSGRELKKVEIVFAFFGGE